MPVLSTPFDVTGICLGKGNFLSIINVQSFTPALKTLIDEQIVSICHGDRSTTKRDLVKKKLQKFLASKDTSKQMGAIAEFILHLFLREQKYKQECLFLNLEENSVKKGFDGYYSKNGLAWILESKSGSIGTATISHQSKLKESYTDLKDKLAGVGSNNPWREAYNHAGHIDVRSKKSLIKVIEMFSDQYDGLKYQNIKDFNIIPGATIFLDGTWTIIDILDLERKVRDLITKLEFCKIHIVCITKLSIDLFIDYLNKP